MELGRINYPTELAVMTRKIWLGAEISVQSVESGKKSERNGTQNQVKILKGQVMEKLGDLDTYISGKRKVALFH